MSQQAPCTSEALVDAARTVSIGEHMVVFRISQLPIERFVFSFSPIVETRVEAAFMFGPRLLPLRQGFHQGVCIAPVASWSPNQFHSKPLFSNEIKVGIVFGTARIEALTEPGHAT